MVFSNSSGMINAWGYEGLLLQIKPHSDSLFEYQNTQTWEPGLPIRVRTDPKKFRSVGRRQRLGLLNLHLFFTAYRISLTCLCTKDLGPTSFTTISFSELCHIISCLILDSYFFSSISCPQQINVPLPPRVTINSTPHFLHIYRFPTWLAILFIISFLELRTSPKLDASKNPGP